MTPEDVKEIWAVVNSDGHIVGRSAGGYATMLYVTEDRCSEVVTMMNDFETDKASMVEGHQPERYRSVRLYPK